MGEVPRNELDYLRGDVEPAEGDRRHAVLPAQQRADLALGNKAELDQIQPEPASIDLLGRERRLDLVRAYTLLRDEQFSESSGHGRTS